MFSKNRLADILLKIIKAGVFFVLFLPLVMNSGFFFPFIVPKNVLFRISVGIIFILYLFLIQLKPEFKPRFNWISIAVLAFVGISTVASLTGIGLYRSFWGNYERMSGLFHLYFLFAYFLVLVGTFKDKKDWHSFLTFSVFASTLMCFLGFAQWLNIPFLLQSSGGNRLSGSVGNPTFFAAYLLFNLFFILYFFIREERFNLNLFSLCYLVFDIYLVFSGILYKLFKGSNWGYLDILKSPVLNASLSYKSFLFAFLLFQILILIIWLLRRWTNTTKILVSVIFLFNFLIFFNTQTRGALIGFIAGITLLVIATLFLSINKRIKLVSLSFLIIIIVFPLVLFISKDSYIIQRVQTLRRLATISLTDITTESRLLTWQASWKGWAENPKSFLIGYGPENYYYVFNKYFPAKIYRDSGSQIWFDRAHNIIFDIGVTTGILGLIAYLAILSLAVLALIRSYKNSESISSSWLWVALIIAYFIQNFFVFDTLNTEVLLYFSLAFIVFLVNKDSKSEPEESELNEEESVSLKINYIYSSILFIALFFILAINVKTVMANKYLVKALLPSNEMNYSKRFSYFKKAIEDSVTGRFEAREQLATYANSIFRRKDIPPSQIKEIIDYSTEELNKSIKEEPLNVHHYIFLASFYNNVLEINPYYAQRVINLMQEALNLSPTRPHIYYELGKTYFMVGNFQKANESFQQAIKLSPNVFDSHWNLLTLYIISKNYDLFEKHFELMKKELNWQPTIDDYARLVNIFSRVENYSKMIEFQNEIVKLQPTFDNYKQLAIFYGKIKQQNKAEEMIKEVIRLNPNLKAEADKFLEEFKAGKY